MVGYHVTWTRGACGGVPCDVDTRCMWWGTMWRGHEVHVVGYHVTWSRGACGGVPNYKFVYNKPESNERLRSCLALRLTVFILLSYVHFVSLSLFFQSLVTSSLLCTRQTMLPSA